MAEIRWHCPHREAIFEGAIVDPTALPLPKLEGTLLRGVGDTVHLDLLEKIVSEARRIGFTHLALNEGSGCGISIRGVSNR